MRSLASMFWPSPFALENYGQLLRKTEFVSWYGNSIVVAVSSTFLATAVGTIGAYALARLRFLGRGFMASATLITYLVPPSILFIPLYAQIKNMGMANSLAGLIAAYPSFTVPFDPIWRRLRRGPSRPPPIRPPAPAPSSRVASAGARSSPGPRDSRSSVATGR
ncbi:MAG: hypothetical protein ACREK6_15745 [Candidatus Rokuibacteriota bacterium]